MTKILIMTTMQFDYFFNYKCSPVEFYGRIGPGHLFLCGVYEFIFTEFTNSGVFQSSKSDFTLEPYGGRKYCCGSCHIWSTKKPPKKNFVLEFG